MPKFLIPPLCLASRETPFRENGTDRSINGRQMLSLHVWRAKQEVTAFWTSPLCSASRETPSSNIWPVLLFVLPFGGSAFCLFTAPVIAIESQGKKLVSISNHIPTRVIVCYELQSWAAGVCKPVCFATVSSGLFLPGPTVNFALHLVSTT